MLRQELVTRNWRPRSEARAKGHSRSQEPEIGAEGQDLVSWTEERLGAIAAMGECFEQSLNSLLTLPSNRALWPTRQPVFIRLPADQLCCRP